MNDSEERLKNLLLRGLDGDAPAYQAFLMGMSTHLRAYFRKRLARLPDEVEDLVQESLLAIHNKRHTYDAGQPLTAWAHAIAKYKLVDLLRRRASRDALTDPIDDGTDFFPPPTATPPRHAGTWASCSTSCPTGSGCRSCIPSWKACR